MTYASPIVPRRAARLAEPARMPRAELGALVAVALLFALSVGVGARYGGPALDRALPAVAAWIENPCPRDPSVAPSPGRSCHDAADAMRRQDYERLRPGVRFTHIVEQGRP